MVDMIVMVVMVVMIAMVVTVAIVTMARAHRAPRVARLDERWVSVTDHLLRRLPQSRVQYSTVIHGLMTVQYSVLLQLASVSGARQARVPCTASRTDLFRWQ